MSYNKTIWETGDVVSANKLNHIEDGIANAVEKQQGKGLSTEDYTTEEKDKLKFIEDGAQVNNIEGVQFNGADITPDTQTKKVNIIAATYDLAVPTGTSDDIGKILEKQKEGFGWVEKPVDGDDAYGVYVKQYDEQHPEDPEHQSQDFMSRDQWLEYNRGKSAREIYNQEKGTSYDDAEFIEAIKSNYPMKYVEYDSNAYGASNPSSISNITPGATTEGKLWFMPNNDNTKTKLFITVNNGTADEPDYDWYNMGVVDVPSNVLTEEMVDNECINGTVDTPASAKAVMDLKAKLEGVTAKETKTTLIENTNWYDSLYVRVTSTDKRFAASSGNTPNGVLVVNVEGVKRVRFNGLMQQNGIPVIGYGFSATQPDTTDTTNNQFEIEANAFDGDTNSGTPVYIEHQYEIPVPAGAKWFACTIAKNTTVYGNVLTIDNFYCYLQSGESVVDSLNHIDGEIDRIDSKFVRLTPISVFETKDNVYLYNERQGKIVTYSTNNEILIYDLNDIDTDLYFNQVGSSVKREAAYVSELDDSNWPTSSGNSATINNWVGYQNLDVGDKLEIPSDAKYVLIEHLKSAGTIQLLKPIEIFDDIYGMIDDIDESINDINENSVTLESLNINQSKTRFYIDSNYKAHTSGNYKLVVFDIQGESSLMFKTQRASTTTIRYAVYVSEIDFTNLPKTGSGTYTINNSVGTQSYVDGDELSIPEGANYVIVSYQYKSSTASFTANPVYVAKTINRYDSIEKRINELEENIKLNLPIYYKDYLDLKTVEISDIFNSGIFKHESGVTPSRGCYKDGFMFYSDPHYPENYMMTGKVMAEIIKNTPIKKLINGGDIVCSHAGEVSGYENDTAGAIRRTIDLLEKDISPVIETGAEYYQVRGNHDFSLKQKNNDNENDNETRFLLVKDVYSYIMSKNMRNPNVVIGENTDDACCFYKDFTSSKLRYIFLDLEDANNTYYNSNNTMRRGYSTKQHTWFCQTLLSTPSDYNIVVISHQPVLIGIYAIDASYTSEHYNIYNKVMDAMLAVNNRKSYTFNNVLYDFTDFTPKILLHQCGHTHSDRIAYNGVWENSIASARDGMHQGMECFFNNAVDNSLIKGTTNESLSDAIIIDNDIEGEINCVRLGPACNRIIHQKEFELTSSLDLSEYSKIGSLGEEAGTIEWYCFDSDNNSYDASTTYSHPSVFRPWHIHATINENGVVSVGQPTQQDLDKIPDTYYYGGTTQIAYKPNKNISGYVTVIAYSADLRIMEFFGVKVTAEG